MRGVVTHSGTSAILRYAILRYRVRAPAVYWQDPKVPPAPASQGPGKPLNMSYMQLLAEQLYGEQIIVRPFFSAQCGSSDSF